MTEREWLSGDDPRVLLESLRGQVSERKLRLFAAACCRRVWHLIGGEPYRRAVEVGLGHAVHGRGTVKQWRAVWQAAWDHDSAQPPGQESAVINASAAALCASVPRGCWSGMPDALAAAQGAASNA